MTPVIGIVIIAVKGMIFSFPSQANSSKRITYTIRHSWVPQVVSEISYGREMVHFFRVLLYVCRK